jgi:hypothetical protein
MTSRDPLPELKDRVLAAVRAEPAPTQTAVRQRGWLTLGISAAIAIAIFAHFGGIRISGRPGLLVVWTCLGWSVVGSAAAALAVARGRSMLGRSTASLLILVGAAPLVLLAWKVGVTVPFGPELTASWPGRPGFRCLGLSLAMAAPLLVALLVMRRRSDPVHPGIAGAALGVTAGVLAGTLVDLWCPIAYLPHVLLGHILPLLVAAAFGAWAGRRLLPP